jgi:hypothetical protein
MPPGKETIIAMPKSNPRPRPMATQIMRFIGMLLSTRDVLAPRLRLSICRIPQKPRGFLTASSHQADNADRLEVLVTVFVRQDRTSCASVRSVGAGSIERQDCLDKSVILLYLVIGCTAL